MLAFVGISGDVLAQSLVRSSSDAKTATWLERRKHSYSLQLLLSLIYLLYAAEDELRFWRDRWPGSRDGETLSPDPEGCAQPLPRADLRREWHGKGAGCAINPLSWSTQGQALHSR